MKSAAPKTPQDRDLAQLYTNEIRKIPVPSREEEAALARLARAGDVKALQALVSGHLRYVQKVATTFASYGLPFNELVQEGNIGLMQAAAKFDPEKGFRLTSYAVFYIAASMRNYALRNWSMVKAATTNKQRQLFFRIRSEFGREMHENGGDKLAADLALAELFGVAIEDIEKMGSYMSGGDFSLQVELGTDDGMAEHETQQDRLPDPGETPDEQAASSEHRARIRELVAVVAEELDERQKVILEMRFCRDEPATLTVTGKRIGLSRERVRQLEGEIRGKLENVFLAARGHGLV